MVRSLILLIALAAVSGCIIAAHSDFLTTVRVLGTVSLPDSAAEPVVTIEVRDVNLDDARRPDQRQILRREVPVGRPFVLEQDYFWGSSAGDPYQDARVAVSLNASDCEDWHREYEVAEILNSEYDIVLEIGEARLACR